MSYKPVGITESSIFPPRVENRITKGASDSGLLSQRALNSLGGVIGTSGKPVICLRVDDWQDHLQAGYEAKFRTRGLPWGHATIARRGSQPWFTVATWENLRGWAKNGCEFWSHGTDHKDPRITDGATAQPVPGTVNGMYDQIVNSKALIEAEGLKCKGWFNPGPSNAFPADGAPYWPDANTEWSDYDSLAGRLITGTYGFSEGFQAGGPTRLLPNRLYHGLNHYTVLTPGVTPAVVTSVIDKFATGHYPGTGMQILIHTAYVDNPDASEFTEADFDAMLDHLVTLWDSGAIEIVTPAAMMAADPTSSHRLDLMGTQGDVAGLPVGHGWTLLSGTTVASDGTDTYFSATGAGARWQARNLASLDLAGETWLFDGWARSATASPTTASVTWADSVDGDVLNETRTQVIPGNTWTRVRFALGTPPATSHAYFTVGKSSGDTIHWKSAHVYKV